MVAVLSITVSGCLSPTGSDGRLRHKKFTVKLSSLDWMEVAYYPRPNDRRFRNICKLSFFGTGETIFKTGRSPQLTSSFSHDVENPYWNEIFADRMHLSEKEMQSVFQAFVNEGAVPNDYSSLTKREKDHHPPYVKIIGTIGYEQFGIATANEHLVSLVEECILDNFETTINKANGAYNDY